MEFNSQNDCVKIGYTYVPIQEYDKTYCPEDGLKAGTIFPELNLPISVYVPKICQEVRK